MINVERFKQNYRPTKEGCWEWKGYVDKDGYGRIGSAFHNAHNRAHRASYLVFNGEIPDGKHVLHKCDNRKCINPEHLWLGTNDENVQDKINKGRQAPAKQGADSHYAKLTEKEARTIINKPRTITHRSLAKEYGVSDIAIRRLRNRETWKNLTTNRNATI